MEIGDRLILIAKEQDLSIGKLGLILGKSRGYVSGVKKNNTAVGSDVLSKIIDEFSQYNIEWVITGEGDKYKTTLKKYTQTGGVRTLNEEFTKELEVPNYSDLVKFVQSELSKNNTKLEALQKKVAGLAGISSIDNELLEAIFKLLSAKVEK